MKDSNLAGAQIGIDKLNQMQNGAAMGATQQARHPIHVANELYQMANRYADASMEFRLLHEASALIHRMQENHAHTAKDAENFRSIADAHMDRIKLARLALGRGFD